ncbi:hypothetical protein DSO57_1026297 [Entomophthora muscae]|uniref:Uncharacterized protein n=1 Tax=Entomophthora muscae TaxID=34485 RepID=A0ACC2T249_9FUNG|nr:hypothetical protein DSO57_1026297 [Entomophthora muscae]
MSKWWLLGDSYEGEIMGIITLFQFVNAAAVFNFGHDFRRAWYHNHLLVIIWSVFTALCFYIVLANPNSIGCLLRFNCGDKDVLESLGYSIPYIPIPTYNIPQGHNVLPFPFRVTLAVYCGSMMLAGILWERFVVLGPVRQYFQSRFPPSHTKINL